MLSPKVGMLIRGITIGKNIYLPQIRQVALLPREPWEKPNIVKRFSRFVRFIWDHSGDHRTRRHEFQPKLPYTPSQ